MIALDRQIIPLISGGLNAKIDFALDVALLSRELVYKMEVLASNAKTILPKAENSIISAMISLAGARMRFKINQLTEGLSILKKV